MVSDVTHEASWNTNCISFVLPLGIFLKLKAIPMPLSPMCTDALTWAYSPSSNFEGKSAYKLFSGGLESPNNFSGQWIWKLDTIPKIQVFVWKCYSHSFPIKDLLMTRGIIEENICELCGRESETIIHELHDYNGSECSIFLDVDTAFCTLYNLGPRSTMMLKF